jgi:hypothetical protein
MLGVLNQHPFVDKNKIVINSFLWGNKNKTHPIFFGNPG